MTLFCENRLTTIQNDFSRSLVLKKIGKHFPAGRVPTLASLTIENYVKTIYLICKQREGAPASTGEVAENLNVSPGSVTSMLKTLKDSGLAEYKPYEGVQLTASGRSLALRILRRHRLIEVFLIEILQFDWDQVHDEAENLEHAVSDLLIDRVDELLGFPVTDPYGDPIPRTDGTLPELSPNLKPLAELLDGESFRLKQVLDQSMEFLRFLTDAQLVIGTRGRVVGNCSNSGVVKVVHNQQETTISREIAEKLNVELVVEVA